MYLNSQNLTGFLFQQLYRTVLIGIILCLLLPSCRSSRESKYFQTLSRDTTITGITVSDYKATIKKKDILAIAVSSLSSEMDAKFNAAASQQLPGVAGPLNDGYLVNEKGKIFVHFIGEVVAEGLTTTELKDKLQNALLPFMKEPIVSVRYMNRKITILGEVEKPQVLGLTEDQMPLIDAIANSGNLTDKANKKDIMIIRGEGTDRTVKHLNLEDHSVFTSPWYYLQNNDIVYVMPRKDEIDKDERRRIMQTTISLLASAVSLVLIIINAATK